MKVTLKKEPDGSWEWRVVGSENYMNVGWEDSKEEAETEARIDIDLEMYRRAQPKTRFTYGPD